MSSYHIPVLLKESVEGLAIEKDSVIVDVTFGGGSHSREILKHLGDNGRLIAFDQDTDSLRNTIEDERFVLNNANFKHFNRFLRVNGQQQVDGVLADLGVSSYQFDTADRGFSFRFQGDLDMRMDKSGALTASDVLNTYTAEDLQSIFSRYGEVRNAKSLASLIVAERSQQKFTDIGGFLKSIGSMVRGNRNKYLAQLFQAIRIEVNDEMGTLDSLLKQIYESLQVGGRVSIISYHSLEDRMVKNFFKTGNVKGEVEQDFYGNHTRPFKLITKKPVLPSDDEIRVNSRARSARLRIAEKI